MKAVTCYEDNCDQTFQSDDRDDILNQLYAHYTSVHPNVIPNASDADKKAWMERFEKDWEMA